MALIKCPECGKEATNSVEICPNCGYPLTRTVTEMKTISSNYKKKMLFPVIFAMVLVILLIGGIIINNHDKGLKYRIYFKTEDEMKEALEGTWELVFLDDSNFKTNNYIIFKEKEFKFISYDENGEIDLDNTHEYKVDVEESKIIFDDLNGLDNMTTYEYDIILYNGQKYLRTSKIDKNDIDNGSFLFKKEIK